MPSPTTEQRIAIICDFNADKIKAIKELMEEASNVIVWIKVHQENLVRIKSGGKLMQDYQLYQQSKQTLNNNL